MKTVSIGDTHGKAIAPEVFKIIDQHDKFIFVGDYVDSFDIPDDFIHENLMEIINLKIQYPDKVVLLWGNHDIQYLLGYNKYGCTGHRMRMHTLLNSIFTEHRNLFQLAYQIKDTIWTHAGVHKGWFNYRFEPYIEETVVKARPLADRLNFAFDREGSMIFDVGYKRGGHYDVGGPLWCDMSELKSSPLRGYNQIVGHTRSKYIQKMNIHNKEIVFIDTLEDSDYVDEKSFFYKEI